MSNFAFNKLSVSRGEFVKLFLGFLFEIKKVSSPIFANFLFLQTYFLGVGTPYSSAGVFPGRRVGYSCCLVCPNSRILIWNPPANKAGQKILAKCESGESASMGKYNQLLLIERIRQSQKFNKVRFYHIFFHHSRKSADENKPARFLLN